MTTYFDETADWFQEQIERLARTGEDAAYLDGLNVDLEEKEAALVRDVTITAEWPGCPPKVRDAIHRVVLEFATDRHQPMGVSGPVYATLTDIAAGLLRMTHRLHDIFHALGSAGLDDFNDDPRTPLTLMAGVGAERREALQRGAVFDNTAEIHGTKWMERKVNEAFRETSAALEEAAGMRAKLAVVSTEVEDVWRYMGDGSDHESSLTCPVVLSAGKLREFVAAKLERDDLKGRIKAGREPALRPGHYKLVAFIETLAKAFGCTAEWSETHDHIDCIRVALSRPTVALARPFAVQQSHRVVRVGFDVGGVLSKYPEILRPIVAALAAAADVEVHVLSDMHPHEKIVDWVITRNGFAFTPEHIHSCDYKTHGEECKAVKAAELGLDVLFDDFMGYLVTVGAPPLRLLAMPDPGQDYYHPTWKTDGSEGNFGRRKKGTMP